MSLRGAEDPGRDLVVLSPDALRGCVAKVCTKLGADEDIAEVVVEHSAGPRRRACVSEA